MPSYPAKPYEIPQDDWFNSNSSSFVANSTTQGTKNISTIHEFFYRQSDLKVGGSDNHIKTNLEKRSSKKVLTSSIQNSYENFQSTSKEKYSYSKIPTELKSIKKRSFKSNSFYKNFSNKNIFNFRSYFLDLKSLLLKIINNKLNNYV